MAAYINETSPQISVLSPNQIQSASDLLNIGSDRSENDITVGVSHFLRTIFTNIVGRTEVTVGGGRVDIIIGGCAIEIKSRGTISEPKNRKQLERYLNTLSQNPRPDLGVADGHHWRGIITDGESWYFYEQGNPIQFLEGLTLSGDKDQVFQRLRQFIDPRCVPVPPADDSSWVESLLHPFTELAEQVKNESYFTVKQKLWADVLAGAHIIPPEDSGEAMELFIRHTLLVTTARLVAEIITASVGDYTEGFSAWISENPESPIVENLRKEIRKYKWVANRDVLKDLYHSTIRADLRHDFGEYYTPDWLASAVVEEVLDEEWAIATLTQAIKEEKPKPQVLDPSCGSGTFIHAAVKRLNSLTDKVDDPEGYFKNPQVKAQILNNLVAGIDLHPVAVELAKTTKLLALETDPIEPLNIWLGDSLQWQRKPEQTLIDPGIISIRTSDGEALKLPEKFILSDDYVDNLKDLIFSQAIKDTGDKDNLTATMVTKDVDHQPVVEDTIQRLRHYLHSGRNGVWEWYLTNVVQPFRLSENKISRLIGNPPWVIFRDMGYDRQSELREHASNRGVWAGGKLAAQNDLASLFVATSVDLYLSNKCKFGFVLPYSALQARQWQPFREGKWDHKPTGQTISADLYEAWNLSNIYPPRLDRLFHV